jgi:hypothetical protein
VWGTVGKWRKRFYTKGLQGHKKWFWRGLAQSGHGMKQEVWLRQEECLSSKPEAPISNLSTANKRKKCKLWQAWEREDKKLIPKAMGFWGGFVHFCFKTWSYYVA